LLVASGLKVPGFLVLMVLELVLSVWAERLGATPWHPHHIAERHGLLTIIGRGNPTQGTDAEEAESSLTH